MKYDGDRESVESTPELCCQGEVDEEGPAKSAKDSSLGPPPEEDNARECTEVDYPENVSEGVEDLSHEELQQDSFYLTALSTAIDASHSDSSDEEEDGFDRFLTDMRSAIDVMSSCTKPVTAERWESHSRHKQEHT